MPASENPTQTATSARISCCSSEAGFSPYQSDHLSRYDAASPQRETAGLLILPKPASSLSETTASPPIDALLKRPRCYLLLQGSRLNACDIRAS